MSRYSRSEASPSGPGAGGPLTGIVSTLAITFRRRSRSRQSRRAIAMSHGKTGRAGSHRSKWTKARTKVSWTRSSASDDRSSRQQKRYTGR